jgi:ribosome-associated heat shock protein Hsp15
VKPSREVRPGDRLATTTGVVRREVVVLATAARRGPAAEAARLYEETPESVAEHERRTEQRRLDPAPAGPRPTKRERRRLERTRRR